MSTDWECQCGDHVKAKIDVLCSTNRWNPILLSKGDWLWAVMLELAMSAMTHDFQNHSQSLIPPSSV